MAYGTDLGRCSYCSAKTLSGQAPHRAQCPTLTIERLRADLAAAEAEVVVLREQLAASDDEQCLLANLCEHYADSEIYNANRAHHPTETDHG